MNTPVLAGPKAGRRFWQTHLKALATSGFSRSEYCRRHNLSYHALTYWVRKQQEISLVKPALALVEVPVRPSLPLRSGAAALHQGVGLAARRPVNRTGGTQGDPL